MRQKDITYFYIFTWVMHNKHCKGESLGEIRTTHGENSSLQQICRIPTHRHYSTSVRSRKMKLSVISQRPIWGCVRNSQQRVCDQKLLMLTDSNY